MCVNSRLIRNTVQIYIMKALAPGKAKHRLEFTCQYFKSTEMNAASVQPLWHSSLGYLKSAGKKKKKKTAALTFKLFLVMSSLVFLNFITLLLLMTPLVLWQFNKLGELILNHMLEKQARYHKRNLLFCKYFYWESVNRNLKLQEDVPCQLRACHFPKCFNWLHVYQLGFGRGVKQRRRVS